MSGENSLDTKRKVNIREHDFQHPKKVHLQCKNWRPEKDFLAQHIPHTFHIIPHHSTLLFTVVETVLRSKIFPEVK